MIDCFVRVPGWALNLKYFVYLQQKGKGFRIIYVCFFFGEERAARVWGGEGGAGWRGSAGALWWLSINRWTWPGPAVWWDSVIARTHSSLYNSSHPPLSLSRRQSCCLLVFFPTPHFQSAFSASLIWFLSLSLSLLHCTCSRFVKCFQVPFH